MGFKQQYHASSGKAKFEPSPLKAMTWESYSDTDCARCEAGKTPKRCKIELRNIVPITTCCYTIFCNNPPSNDYLDWKPNDILSTVEGPWTLKQSAANACVWSYTDYTDTTIYGKVDVYSPLQKFANKQTCQTFDHTADLKNLVIVVVKLDATTAAWYGSIQGTISYGGQSVTCQMCIYEHEGAPDNNCIDIDWTSFSEGCGTCTRHNKASGVDTGDIRCWEL